MSARETERFIDACADALPEIKHMGLMPFDPVYAVREHSTPENELLHVVEGAVDLVTPQGTLSARKGDTLFVPAKTPHRDEFDVTSDLVIFYTRFTWREEAAYFERVPLGATLRLPPQRKAELSAIFDQLRTDVTSSMQEDRLLARSRVLTILLLILREALAQERNTEETRREQEASAHRHRQLVARAKTYLQKNLSRPITLTELADHLHVSPYHLSHVFSQESNFSLFAFLTKLRMDKAKALLREGRLNVSQVALDVGYSDPNYFSKAFRARCGCSPTEFVGGGRPDPDNPP